MAEGVDRVRVSGDEFRYQADADYKPSEAVISAVSMLAGVSTFEHSGDSEDVMELPPLYDAVDTDALDAIFGTFWDDKWPGVSVAFDYSGYAVTVESTGEISVTAEE